jgi:hypothetical protein
MPSLGLGVGAGAFIFWNPVLRVDVDDTCEGGGDLMGCWATLASRLGSMALKGLVFVVSFLAEYGRWCMAGSLERGGGGGGGGWTNGRGTARETLLVPSLANCHDERNIVEDDVFVDGLHSESVNEFFMLLDNEPSAQ